MARLKKPKSAVEAPSSESLMKLALNSPLFDADPTEYLVKMAVKMGKTAKGKRKAREAYEAERLQLKRKPAAKKQVKKKPVVTRPVTPKARGSFDAYLLKQTKKNHKYLVQTLKTRWRLSKSKNPKLKMKLARLIGSKSNTSAEALKSIEDHRARMRTEVMKEIMAQGAHGSTTYEIEQALNMLHQTASARVYELTGRGQIVDSGRRRKTGSGRNAVVHVQPQFQDSLESE